MPLVSAVWLLQGYIVGTYLYFAIVFSLPICMGLAAVAMDLPVSLLLLLLLSLCCCSCLSLCALPCPALPCPIMTCLLSRVLTMLLCVMMHRRCML